MVASALHLTFFFIALLVLFVPGFSLLSRIFYFVLFIGLLWLSITFLRKPSFSLLNWLKKDDVSISLCFVSSMLLLMTILSSLFIPHEGIDISFYKDKEFVESMAIDEQRFEIPPQISVGKTQDFDSAYVKTYFTIKEPVQEWLFYAHHGDIRWKIDGEEFAYHLHESPLRYLRIQKPLAPGTHLLECFVHDNVEPFPLLSAAYGFSIDGKMSPLIIDQDAHASTITLFLPYVLGIITFFFFIPIINYCWRYLIYFYSKHPKIVYAGLFLVGLILFVVCRSPIYQITSTQYEADEAAFGLMAQQLLKGQAPPLFHYGQNYQGTIEVFPLAAIIDIMGSNAFSLHLLPNIYHILFIVLMVGLFWRFIHPLAALFALIFYSIGGIHFHWIFAKTWFGYSFTLVTGACLLWISFASYHKNNLTVAMAAWWGILAGISFYALPLSLPIILITFALLLWPQHTQWNNFSFRHTCSEILSKKKTLLVALIFLGIGLSPYFIDRAITPSNDAVSFLSEGRYLPPPRVAGERPLFDRFISECVPVILGVRAPFNQQDDVVDSIFSYIPSTIFIVFLLYIPLFLHKKHPYYFYIFYLLTVVDILLVTYSPFGIWPWYAIPLYITLPYLFYVFIVHLYHISPALITLLVILIFLPLFTALDSYNSTYHQPTSLAMNGLNLSTDFTKVKDIAKKEDIRFFICEQGFDTSPDHSGRDWVGECLTFDSNQEIIAIDRMSRRIPALAYELMTATRVGYIFHKNFYYHPRQGNLLDNQPLTISNLDALFGDKGLNYKRYETDLFYIYIPSFDQAYINKFFVETSSSTPYYLDAAMDHNMLFRLAGKDAYWSSGEISENGASFTVTFRKPIPLQKIVQFHGPKWQDHPRNCNITLIDSNGKEKRGLTFDYHHDARSSILLLPHSQMTKKIIMKIPNTNDGFWWTIYEMWFL